MSGALIITIVVTSAAFAAFTSASAGQVPAATAANPAFQSGWQQALKTIGAEFQGPGYMVLAAATVRDHRTKKGDWKPTDESATPPPLQGKKCYRLPSPIAGVKGPLICK